MSLESETPELYRAEYLGYSIIRLYQQSPDLSLNVLQSKAKDDDLLTLVKEYGNEQYREGYEKGIHDVDAVSILTAVLPLWNKAGDLKYDPYSKALAQLFGFENGRSANQKHTENQESFLPTWKSRAVSAQIIATMFNDERDIDTLVVEMSVQFSQFYADFSELLNQATINRSSRYLLDVLANDKLAVTLSKQGHYLVSKVKCKLNGQTWDQLKKPYS